MSLPPNLSYTRFIFVVPRREDEPFLTRLRNAGSAIARGFFNDFDAEGPRESQPLESMQFLVADGEVHPESPISAARYVVQVSGKYRPRLLEVETDLKRRTGEGASFLSLEGAERAPRYTSAELHDFAYKRAALRRTGRQSTCAVILPLSKTDAWWSQGTLDRHAFFYPHIDQTTGCPVQGHARAAEEGIATLYRRLFHNPDGYQRAGEYDFLTYFECAAEEMPIFDRVHQSLRDTSRNPEWKYVREGPIWKGRRVLRW